jgi:hypothetical protein
VAIAQTDIHLNNSVINIDGTGFSAEAGLTIANATGTITSINLDHNGNGGEGSTASAEINGDFAIGNITVHSSRGSSDLELGNGGDDNVITMTGNQILVTAGILPADVNGARDTASAYLNAENVHGSISNISVRTTATSMSGEAIAVLNGNFTLAQSTLDIVATGKDAIAGMTLYGSGGNTDLPNYDVTLTSMAIGLEATDFESRASLDLADALGTITSISVVASGLSADASADIDFSGSLSGNISVTASGSETVADLYMTAGTPTDLTLAWYDSSRGGAGFAFVAGQTYTLTVGATTLSYTMQAGDVVAGDNLTRTVNLINGLKTDADYAGADFQLLHPYNDNGGMNSFHVMWNDASAVNRDEFSLTCDDGVTLSNMRDYGLWTRYETDHDGSDITLTSATDITATASGAHSSAIIELDNLVGNIDTITAIASGGNLVSTANYYHDAFGNNSSSDFAGASAEVVLRVDGSVSNIVINATNIEDRALVAVSQTVQGGTATVSGDGRTALHLGDATVDMVNLTALHNGTWGAFDLNLAMADADLGAADAAALTASMITIDNFNGDRDSINLFSPYDTTTNNWAWNFNNTAMHYSENEGDALLFSTFLTDAEAALDGNTAANPDYYFGVVGSDGYLAYDMGGTGITGVLKLAGVTSFDEANVGDHDRWKLLGDTSGNVTDIILNDATRIEYASNVGVYNASTLGIEYTSAGLIDSLSAHANAAIGADDSVSLTLTENGTGDIIFRQALIAVSADTGSVGGTACGADATLTVSDARGTIERITLNADAGHDAYAVSYDSSATANFYAFSGAVNEIELVALGNADRDAFVELNMIGATALTESVQNLCMTVESADATANLKLSNGFVVKTEVFIDSSDDVSVVTLGIEQTIHGGEVFATSFMGDTINNSHDYVVGCHATFDLTYINGTADKVSLGHMSWDSNVGSDVFTLGNFEGAFKLMVNVTDADLDGANGADQTTLLANMLTIDGFDTGGTSLDTTNAWLDDTLSIIGTTSGTDHLAINTANAGSMASFLTAADTALDTDTVYFGVVNGNGYLAYDQDNIGITGVIEFLGMTDLDYTRINGMAT